jgi:hypothetical protein
MNHKIHRLFYNYYSAEIQLFFYNLLLVSQFQIHNVLQLFPGIEPSDVL